MFFWAVLEKNIPFILNFVFTILLARLVTPEMYGLVAMTAILTALARVLQNLGFSSALIQREKLTEQDLTTTFVVNLGIGSLIVAILLALADQIALFFERAEIVLVVQANALALFLAALGIVQMAMLQREYRFRIGLMIEIAAILVAGVAALVAALQDADLLALLLIMVLREAVRTVLLWVLVRWRPKGGFSISSLRALWGFARHMIGASLYHHLATNLTGLLLGKFYSATTLGLFSRAQSLQLLPVSLITQPLQRVAFPLYSRSQKDLTDLVRMLRMHSRIVSVLAGAITACLATTAHEIVLILVGDAWSGSVPMLEILAFAAFFNVTFPLHSEANKAIGESRWFFWIEVAKKTALVGLVVLGIMQGVTWLLWALVASSVLDYLLSATTSVRYLGYTWRQQAFDIAPGMTLAGTAIAAVWITDLSVTVGIWGSLGLKIFIVSLVFAVGIGTLGARVFPEIHAFGAGLAKRLMAR